MALHDIKCEPEYFHRTWVGHKLFEIRKNDRNYEEGDCVIINEWNPGTQMYTGRTIDAIITYVTDYKQGKKWVVFGIRIVKKFDLTGPVR